MLEVEPLSGIMHENLKRQCFLNSKFALQVELFKVKESSSYGPGRVAFKV